MKMEKQKLSAKQWDDVIKLLMHDWHEQASGYVQAFGYEGITAELFEDMVKECGMTLSVIKAISTYYADEIKTED